MIKYHFIYVPYLVVVMASTMFYPVQASVPVPDVYDRLWTVAATAASDVAFLDHPVYLLIRQDERVRVTAIGEFSPAPVLPVGVEMISQRHGWLEAWCTKSGLSALADDARTRAIHPPLRFVPAEVSTEGLNVMAAGPYHAAGVGGSGVRVAIVDVDFTGHEVLLGTELPAEIFARSFVDPALEPYRERSSHGTAVAEIIHDIAPEADLIFLTILEQSDFPDAVTWCLENDIDIVSMSLGFLAGPRDGSSFISTEVDRAADAGILWVNSTGNAAASHWGGDWVDLDLNSYLEFAPGREVIGFTYPGSPGGGTAFLVANLTWDRWPSSPDLSLDLEIYRDSLRTEILASSNGQPSVTLPFRLVALDNPLPGIRYFLAVKRQAGAVSGPLRLDLFNDEAVVDMEPRVAHGSLLIPADARGAVSVGAYDFGVSSPSADPVRFYSSRGPTWDGRIKPEIVAADGVSTATYGNRFFYGTSASAPHVAGAAALLSSATVTGGLFTYIWSLEDLLRLFAVRSIDFGPPGVDSTYGWGGLVLPPATSRADAFAAAAYPNPFNLDLVIAFRAERGEAYTVFIFDVLGRQIWRAEGVQSVAGEVKVIWPGRDSGGRDVGSGAYFFRIETSKERVLGGRAVLLK